MFYSNELYLIELPMHDSFLLQRFDFWIISFACKNQQINIIVKYIYKLTLNAFETFIIRFLIFEYKTNY